MLQETRRWGWFRTLKLGTKLIIRSRQMAGFFLPWYGGQLIFFEKILKKQKIFFARNGGKLLPIGQYPKNGKYKIRLSKI